MDKPHCKRSTGTYRAWFHTREEAEQFARDPANINYHGDVAHLCAKCGYFHLSKPEWLEKERSPTIMKVCPLCGMETNNLIHNLATNVRSCWRCLGEPDCMMLRHVEITTKHGFEIHFLWAESNKLAIESVMKDRPEILEVICRPLPN